MSDEWEAKLTVIGARLELGDGERYVYIRPNQFGKVSSFGIVGHYPKAPTMKQVTEACDRARLACPPIAGRYGHRASEHRLRLCQELARELSR
jgi:hypothetical protein